MKKTDPLPFELNRLAIARGRKLGKQLPDAAVLTRFDLEYYSRLLDLPVPVLPRLKTHNIAVAIKQARASRWIARRKRSARKLRKSS